MSCVAIALVCFLFISALVLNRDITRQAYTDCSDLIQSTTPCPPSTCGHINISHPFRLKGRFSDCGNPDYEFTCNNNNETIFNLFSGEYYVTQISYDILMIKLIEVSMTNRSCHLPLRSLPASKLMDSKFPFSVSSQRWATFVGCSMEVKNTSMYMPVPCLSHNNTFIYLILDGYESYRVGKLESSCSFLAMTPMDYFDSLQDSQKDIFKILSQGFTLMQKERCYRVHSYFVLWLLFTGAKPLTFLILLGRYVFAPLVVLGYLVFKLCQKMMSIDNVEKFLRNQQSLVPTRYAYTDIIALTSHFKEKLGQGGFGSVFKGRLPGNRLIAVKMLRNSKSNGEDFINEVSTIGTIHHFNVVRLIGFCSEGSLRALVYEYMPNGSLDKYIFSSNNGGPGMKFSLEKLIDIASGIARGINYLHRGCHMQILHFDIKPHNILLDHGFNPKVSDFGLAKLYPREYSLVTVSAARGTIGYIAPELISRSFGVISHKSDVYSFGMLLLEMAGGRRNADPRAENSSQVYYPSWIYDKLTEPVYHAGIEIETDVLIKEGERKLCMVGLWCIQMRPSDRPPMSKVVEMLEGEVDSLQMPPKPFFSAPRPTMSLRVSCLKASSEEELVGSPTPTELTTISENDHEIN